MFSLHIKLFWKIKRGLELVTLPPFPHNCLRKMFLLLCSINCPNFMIWLPLLCERLGNMCIGIVCKPGCDFMNFEVSLIFLFKLFFLHDHNVAIKTKISLERKKLLRRNKKHFSSFLNGFQSSKITYFFGRWEPDFNYFFKKYRSNHQRGRSSHLRCSVRKAFLKIYRKTSVLESFLSFLKRDSNISAFLWSLRNF